MVKVTAVEAPAKRSKLGMLKGQFEALDDFDTMGQEEIIRLFEEGE